MKSIEIVSENPMDYVRVALAIETLAYHNKSYLWSGDNNRISEAVQALLSCAIEKK